MKKAKQETVLTRAKITDLAVELRELTERLQIAEAQYEDAGYKALAETPVPDLVKKWGHERTGPGFVGEVGAPFCGRARCRRC